MLEAAIAQGRDNFLLLRIGAALLVIFGHSYAVKAGPVEHDFIARLGWAEGVYTGSLAVDAFFFISGFLVTGSWQRQGSLLRFLQARAARLLPAYWALLLATVLVLGPLLTTLPLADYLHDRGTRDYLIGNLRYDHRWFLPGVFEHNPLPRTVNGSLWTLRGEVAAYLALALAGVLGILRRPLWTLLATPLAIAGVLYLGARLGTPQFVPLLLLFGCGSACWTLRRWLPLSGLLLLALLLATWALHGTPLFRWLLGLATGYLCLWLAYVPRLWQPQRLGDLSYGLYLWGFPVQQIVALLSGSDNTAFIFLVSAGVTGLLAAASWHWLEAPALRWLRPSRRTAAAPPTPRGKSPDGHSLQ